ncbi:MAG: prepilin peptidase [Candidatus Aenigmatarchaeota archaeon]
MFVRLSIGIALGASALAGVYDLKTTEIPDWLSLGMVITGLLLNLIRSLVEWNPMYIFRSASIGSAFFTFGLIMYLGGQWGGGDAKVLAGLGALLPTYPLIHGKIPLLSSFPVALLINVFLIGAIYMLIYAFGISLTRREVIEDFKTRVQENPRRIALLSALPLAVLIATVPFVSPSTHALYLIALVPVIAGVCLLLRFLKAVEETGFVKKVDPEELEPGDMLAEEVEEIDTTYDSTDELKNVSLFLLSFVALPVAMYIFGRVENLYFYAGLLAPTVGIIISVSCLFCSVSENGNSVFKSSSTRIRGLEEDEVEEIRESRDEVKIREGVRFVPVFPISVLVTLQYGNLLLTML